MAMVVVAEVSAEELEDASLLKNTAIDWPITNVSTVEEMAILPPIAKHYPIETPSPRSEDLRQSKKMDPP